MRKTVKKTPTEETFDPPNPIEELRQWVARNRPDVSGNLREVFEVPELARAVEFISALAFAAGRTWQHNNPGNTALLGK